jgi:hypothetical protein
MSWKGREISGTAINLSLSFLVEFMRAFLKLWMASTRTMGEMIKDIGLKQPLLLPYYIMACNMLRKF